MIGNVGVIMVLGAYLLVSSNRIKSISPIYQALNLAGAIILIGYSLALDEVAYASVVLNSVWALIAVWALVLNSRRSKTPSPESDS